MALVIVVVAVTAKGDGLLFGSLLPLLSAPVPPGMECEDADRRSENQGKAKGEEEEAAA